MSEPTIELDSPPMTPANFASVLREAAHRCLCTPEQKSGEVVGTEDCCPSCQARKWLNEGAELVDSL